jgi:hypothetical protein
VCGAAVVEQALGCLGRGRRISKPKLDGLRSMENGRVTSSGRARTGSGRARGVCKSVSESREARDWSEMSDGVEYMDELWRRISNTVSTMGDSAIGFSQTGLGDGGLDRVGLSLSEVDGRHGSGRSGNGLLSKTKLIRGRSDVTECAIEWSGGVSAAPAIDEPGLGKTIMFACPRYATSVGSYGLIN